MTKNQRRRSKTKTNSKRTRYKNEPFLKALGERCKQLRIQKDYSIDRLAREANRLSSATIDRLERGTSDSQILVLLRYAEALGYSLSELFSHLDVRGNPETDHRIIPYDDETKPPGGYVPVYPIKVAAGYFVNPEPHDLPTPLGWVDAGLRSNLSDEYFAAYVKGESMEPRITNGALCLFRRYMGGSRQNRIFLLQARGLKDTETGESFVIKKYVRQTAPRKSEDDEPSVIHLVSENPRFSPVVLVGVTDEQIQTIAEFIKVLGSTILT